MGSNELESQHVVQLSTPTTGFKVKDFIWSEDEWPLIKHNDFDDGDDVPTISLVARKKTEEYELVCQEMVNACGRWGFFKLVHHGVVEEIVEKMKEQCLKLFDLSMEQKLRGARSTNLPLGYMASNPDYSSNLPWAEILQLLHSPQQVMQFSQKVYGGDHQPLSDAILKYSDALDGLGMILLEMLAHGLGLDDDYFTKNFNDKSAMMIRVNQYPPCPLPERCLGLGSHSDPHTLTILLQDEVGGLQVQRDDGEWVCIRPNPGSFVVNIGDTLEAWTNGRLKSVVHRAVVNKEKKRLSIAYFLSPGNDTLVDCPLQLLGSRRKYCSFTWEEFKRELLIQRRVVGKEALGRYLISYPE